MQKQMQIQMPAVEGSCRRRRCNEADDINGLPQSEVNWGELYCINWGG